MSHRIRHAYHVTNCTLPEQQPKWSHLETSPIDRYYNGVMADLIDEGVFFSTTLRDDDLPLYTLYPKTGRRYDIHWRVSIPLRGFHDYRIIQCHRVPTNGGEQFALLLVPPEDLDLNERIDEAIFEEEVSELTGKANNYLCRNDRTKQWRTNNYNDLKAWVNFVVPHNILLGAGTKWDTVEHM